MSRTLKIECLGLPRRMLQIGFLAILSISAMGAIFPIASAQPGVVTVSPGYINLGMITTITVAAPAPGTYNVAVQAPSGSTSTLPMTFTAQGQKQTAQFGNLTSGYGIMVNQVGTYNVVVTQGSTDVGTTSFYTTNQIYVTTDMISAGYCNFMESGSRGQELLFQIHAVYASNLQPIAPTTAAAALDKVSFSLPDGTSEAASFHAAEASAWPVPWFQAHVWGTWNVSWVGTYAPVVQVTDPYGNTGSLNTNTIGYTFQYYAANLQTSMTLTDTSSGKAVAGLVSNEGVTIAANVQYLVTPVTAGQGAPDAVAGFNGPLDQATRGGVVTAQVGWGFYNTTTNTFGSAKQPGGLIATVPLSYSTTSKLWTGNFNTGTLPVLPANLTSYTVILNAHDKASPPNTGAMTMSVPLLSSYANVGVATGSTTTGSASATATSTVTSTTTATAISTTTAFSTAISTLTTTAISTAVSTAISTVSSIISSVSTATTTTVSVAISTILQTASSVPDWAYVIMALLVIIGGLVGFVVKGETRPQTGAGN